MTKPRQLLLLGLVLLGSTTTAFGEEGVVVHRQGIFKVAHGHLLAIKSILLLQHGSATEVGYHANGIRAAYDHLGDAFPVGSGDGETRAKPNIWTDREKFDRLQRESSDAATAMVEAASVNDHAKQVDAFKKLAGSCKACHDDFRKK